MWKVGVTHCFPVIVLYFFCPVGVAFCMSGLDAMYVSLVGEGEEETNGPEDPMAAPTQDPAISLHQRIGEASLSMKGC
jgi:hypothetical protein